MALVSEIELPAFDSTDPSMRGDRFHEVMRELSSQGWLAQDPFGYVVLDRESAEFFLRTRSAIFPGMKIAEIFGVTEGPLYEEMKWNILHINGADHTRLRSLVNPALSPRAVERYRPAMKDFLQRLLTQVTAAAAAQDREVRVRRCVRQAVPLDGDRGRDGRAARGCAKAASLVELDPEAIRRGQHGRRAGRNRAGR
jgi:cytochrome P450